MSPLEDEGAFRKETPMTAILILTVAILGLVAAVGAPYGQTWYGRWHG